MPIKDILVHLDNRSHCEVWLETAVNLAVAHHAHLIDELQTIKERGIEQWVEEQEKAGRCPQCGKRLYWYTRRCTVCNTRIR